MTKPITPGYLEEIIKDLEELKDWGFKTRLLDVCYALKAAWAITTPTDRSKSLLHGRQVIIRSRCTPGKETNIKPDNTRYAVTKKQEGSVECLVIPREVTLSPESGRKVLKILDDPPPPTEAMKKLFAKQEEPEEDILDRLAEDIRNGHEAWGSEDGGLISLELAYNTIKELRTQVEELQGKDDSQL